MATRLSRLLKDRWVHTVGVDNGSRWAISIAEGQHSVLGDRDSRTFMIETSRRHRREDHPPVLSQRPAVRVDNLVKRYPKAPVNAVDSVSFTVASGEVFGLLGPSGAGKTTTIAVLTTRARPTAGEHGSRLWRWHPTR